MVYNFPMTPDLTLNVGQVIYLLANKDARVYPVLVTEQIDKKTLSGNSTSYVVRLPTEEKKEVNLEEIKSEVFISVEEARKSMIEKASKQIDTILDQASEIAKIFPTSNSKAELGTPEVKSEQDSENNFAFVELGNGQQARLNIKDLDKIKGENV